MINYNFLSCADSDGNIKEINVCPAEKLSSASATGKVLVWYSDKFDSKLYHIAAEDGFVKESSLTEKLDAYMELIDFTVVNSTFEVRIKDVSGIDAGIYIHVLSTIGIYGTDLTFTRLINWLFPAGDTSTLQSVQASGGIIINGKMACVTNVTFKSNGQIVVNYFWENNGSGSWNAKTTSASDLDASSECWIKLRQNSTIIINK